MKNIMLDGVEYTPVINTTEPIILEQTSRFEVASTDLPKSMTWNDAVKACADLEDGWRLPTKNELNFMYLNKDKIGGFANFTYWSSTEFNNFNAWKQYFNLGYLSVSIKNYYYNVRAVRDVK